MIKKLPINIYDGYMMPSEKNHCVYHIIAEKFRPESGVKPRVSRLTYKRVTN